MRLSYAIVLAIVLSSVPSVARAQGSVDGFGAVSVDKLSTDGGRSSTPLDFGGRVAIDIAPPVQAIGEFGRIGNVLPLTTTTLFTLSPVDVRASAFYAEGGLRLLGAGSAPVSPYVEATAGIARLNFGVGGLGSTAGVLTNAALNFLDRTDTIAGVGGGVLFRGGPVVLDLGYRYKKIFADDVIGSALSIGQGLHAHQLRLGIGVRF